VEEKFADAACPICPIFLVNAEYMPSSKSKKHKKDRKKEKKGKEKKRKEKSDKKGKRERDKAGGGEREHGEQGACVEQEAKRRKHACIPAADAGRDAATKQPTLNTVPAADAPLPQLVQRKMMVPTEAQAAAAPRPKPSMDAATLDMWRQYNAVADRDRSQYTPDFLKWSDARRAGL